MIHSSHEVTTPTAVFGNNYKIMKNTLIHKKYKKAHSERPVLYESPGVALRIAWFGARAILCLKNETEKDMIVCLEITKDNVFFEDFKNVRKKEEMLRAGHH